MNFDYGRLLTDTFQITWKHKVLWVILALPMVLSFAILPFVFAYIFILGENGSAGASTILDVIGMLVFMIFMIANVIMYVITTSSMALGIIRIEHGEGSLKFMDLLKDGLAYFWRQLGVLLIIQASIVAIFIIFLACTSISSFVTMGLASFCFQPLFILLMPLAFLSMGVLEGAHAAVIAENLDALNAVRHAINLVREHVGKYIIMTLIIYMGVSLISSIFMLPAMFPVFLAPAFIESNQGLGDDLFSAVMLISMCIFLPFTAFFSVLSQAVMKTSLTLTYLRLAQPAEERTVSLQETP
jgi:hypothetical protein